MKKIKQKFKIESREDKGRYISINSKIIKIPAGWRIISQTNPRKSYVVKNKSSGFVCSCPDFKDKNNKCKHIFAIQFKFYNKEEETVLIGDKKIYSQNWVAYNRAQTTEKLSFMRFLREICDLIDQPKYKFGRPTYPFGDMLFGAVMKVYTGFSLRRFMSDMVLAQKDGLVDITPNYSTFSNFMNRDEVKLILENLIKISASPLSGIETHMAVDSSGFSTSRFARWFDYKWGKEKRYKVWIKAHISSGVKTNIITAVNITSGTSADSNELKSLLDQTSKRFNMKEVSGDKAYSSKKNLEIIESHGAIPFIPFKSNVTGRRGGSAIWGKMYHYFMYRNEEFMKHYNKRSNVETCFHMIKSKFGDSIKSKNETAQINELLMKVLCHNLVVLIHEICELGIKAEFNLETQ